MATPRSPQLENRLPHTDKCIKCNQLDLQPSLIIFMIYVQRLANIIQIVMFWVIGQCLYSVSCLDTWMSLYGLSLCWAGHNHLRQINR